MKCARPPPERPMTPHETGGGTGVAIGVMFDPNIALRGVASVRACIPELLPDVLGGTVDASRSST
ncbi:hypothetical protein GCM10010276_58740 [Streptomyces longisporus]|uniref:Uncharacterized protein n=1 Tax=Streptomyces longisporus TaxID=1948 RepID=A0ABN3MQL8_STRLO